jgi:hypothetical protein
MNAIEFVPQAATALRMLKISGEPIRYASFARAIGMLGKNETWTARHRTMLTKVLRFTKLGYKGETLPFDMIVAGSGKPGAGYHKNTEMVVR